MKVCPKCSNSHSQKGTYCSRSCANARQWSQQDKENKSLGAKNSWKNPTLAMVLGIQKKVNGNSSPGSRKKNILEPYFKEGKTDGISIKFLKEILNQEQNRKCQECGTGSEWNGKKLNLELDHINGNSKDNSRLNIRLLCPNCHSQQVTSYISKKVLDKKLVTP